MVKIIHILLEVVINLLPAIISNMYNRKYNIHMKQELLNKVILCSLATLFPMTIALVSYIYVQDKESVEKTFDVEHASTAELKDKVDNIVEDILTSKNIFTKKVNNTETALLEKIYAESRDTNEKINELRLNSEIASKNYEVLSAKLDHFVEQTAKERTVLATKIESHEQRLSLLEKNVSTIAQEKNITLFGWKYGYGN